MSDNRAEDEPEELKATSDAEALTDDLLAGDIDTEDVPESKKTTRPIVVGIGASAGGLEALSAFFDALPPDTGLTFVVVTHLSPDHESILDTLLQRHTAMPVIQVQAEPVHIAPNHVYVIPPNRQLVLSDHNLHTGEFDGPRASRAPIDIFFRSLAAVHAEPIAIILSGGGSDGALGVRSVKEAGGVILVQDPADAGHDSMPLAAIATGVVDFVLPVRELAQKVVAINRQRVRVPSDPQHLSSEQQDTLQRILTQLQARTGHDFRAYKQTTILRRVQRRLQITGHETLEGYLPHLRQSVDETEALLRDLLIGVTNFFRDEESWRRVAQEVVPQLFHDRGAQEVIRVWSLGCSTGEEAYSLAILLLEHAATLDTPPQLQVFATDMDEQSLNKARDGLYPDTIAADVSAERLGRYFNREGSYYRVRREVRDIVLFATHSVLRDPPFSRLDLIVCRNLLIYLQRPLQDSLFEIFHYALRPGGYMFLGSSESADSAGDLFLTVDKKHRFYRRREWSGRPSLLPTLPLLSYNRRQPSPSRSGEPRPAIYDHFYRTGYEQTLEEFGPAMVLVDDESNIVRLSGMVGRFLRHPDGVPTHNLNRVIHPELQFELRSTLFRAFEKKQPTISAPIYLSLDGEERRVFLSVQPRVISGEQSLALVMILEDQAVTIADEVNRTREVTATDEATKRLAEEVHQLRERLQTSGEEYESSSEELKAANEELQSINEEYRSTTEELETSKEELQSVNEELETVNNELKGHLEDMARAHSDLQNLMAATEIATLFLDRELRIKRFTAGVETLFNIMPGDRGRPLTHLTHLLDYPDLTTDARRVLRTLVPLEREVRHTQDGWFLARLRPYRTVEDRIEGVVITFVDITSLKAAEHRLYDSQRLVALALDAAGMGWGTWNLATGRAEVDGRTRELLGFATDSGEITLMGWLEHVHADDRRALEAAIRAGMAGGDVLSVTFRVRADEGAWRNLHASGMFIANDDDSGQRLTIILRDETERLRNERALNEARESLQQALWSTGLGWGVLDLAGGVLDQDARAREIAGFTADEPLTVDRLLARIHPDDRSLVEADQIARAAGQANAPLEYRLIWPNGEIRHIRGTGRLRYDAAGNPHQLTGTLEDITERQRNEATLHALTESLEERVAERTRELEAANAELTTTRDRFTVLFNTSPVPTAIHQTNNGLCLDANPAFLEFLGRPRDEVVGRRPADLFHHMPAYDDPAGIRDELARHGRLRDLETTFTLRPGDERTILLSLVPLTLDGREVNMIALTDITERKRSDKLIAQQQQSLAEANAELAAARDHFRALFHANPVPSVILRIEDLAAVDANEAFLAFHGLPREQIIGRAVLNLVTTPTDNDRGNLSALYRREGGLHDQEMVIRLLNGEERTVLVSDTPIRLEGQRCTLATLIDITQRKQAEEQMREFASQLSLAEQTERQRIAAILHDDLQQRLYALQVRLASAYAWAGQGDTTAAAAEVEQMRGALLSAIELTRRLTVDLSPPILQGEGLYHAIIWLSSRMKEEYGLEVAVQLETAWQTLEEGMRVALFQIVRELLFNIVKHAGVDAATVRLAQSEGEVVLRVSDEGVGFDVGQALAAGGHGLAQAQQRVELYGGRMVVASQPGAGTQVTITMTLKPATP
jgi:two-component system CheB/CheR fusion protein